MVETWLHSDVSNGEISIVGYSVIRKDSEFVKTGQGGGVLLYIKQTLLMTNCDKLNALKNESVWCKIKGSGNSNVLIGVAYKIPNILKEELHVMFEMLRGLTTENVILMDDFNYPAIDWSSLNYNTQSEEFSNIVTYG